MSLAADQNIVTLTLNLYSVSENRVKVTGKILYVIF